MSIESFDDFNDGFNGVEEDILQKSYQHRDDKSDEGTLEWLKQNLEHLEKKSANRITSYRRWSALYKGLHWRVQDANDYNRSLEATSNNKKPRMVDNFIAEFIDSRVSQAARFGSNFTAIPWNNEIADQNVAKACEKLLKSRADELDFDKFMRDSDRVKYKYGTVFLKVCWNKELGDTHPKFLRLEELYPKGIPKEIMKKLGNDKTIKIGDVELKLITPDKIFPEYIADNGDWSKIRYLHETEWVDIWDLKADYPNKKDEISKNDRTYYDYATNEIQKPRNMGRVHHFYHPPTKYLPKGEYIKWVDGAILERKAYPYKHNKIPFIVDRDIEIEGDLWGRPRITHIEQMNKQYNNISSSQARDLGAGSAPKWVAQKGSLNHKQINNEFALFEFKGNIPPTLVKGNPISSDGIAIQDRMEKRMGKHMQVYDISRGEVPQGITANSALRFLDEQEGQILADDERKRKVKVLSTYKQMISIMGQYYRPDDNRMVRRLGKNNRYMIESMQKADFTKVYDVQFQNTSSLPDTKTGKIAAIIDLNTATQTDPIFRREDIVNMLDLATDETFTEEATYSLDTAKQFFEMLLNGEMPPEPEMHDDLLVYYTTWFRAIQSYQFKTTVPENIKQLVYTYIETVEGLLHTKSTYNMKTQMALQNIEYFPSFYELPPVAPTPPEQVDAPTESMDTSKMKNTQENIDNARKMDQA